MKNPKIHFVYNPDRSVESRFVDRFITVYGQCNANEAELFIAVGGDGTVLHAMRESLAHGGRPVAGIKPPESHSIAWLGNKGLLLPEDIGKFFDPEYCDRALVSPLECEVHYGNGGHRSVHAFNDVSVVRTTHHACYLDIKTSCRKGMQNIKGDGLIISTALGSTGINYSYGGPKLAAHRKEIILTGMGIYQPMRKPFVPWSGFRPRVLPGSTRVHIDIAYGEQFYGNTIGRPVRVDFDTGSLLPDLNGSAIAKVTVRKADDRAISLIRLKPKNTFPFRRAGKQSATRR